MKIGGLTSAVVLLLAGTLLTGGGCAATESARTEPASAPTRAPAARWEAVMLPEATGEPLRDVEWAWWDERRDEAVAARQPGPLLATDEWPEPARPSLDRSRTVSLPSRPETIIYFRPDHRRR